MKFTLTIVASILSLTSAAVLGPRADEVVSYDGYKVFRIATGDSLSIVQDKLADFDLHLWNIDLSKHIDVAISPEQLERFEALELDTSIMHEDLGADIAAEFNAAESSSGTYLTHRVTSDT